MSDKWCHTRRGSVSFETIYPQGGHVQGSKANWTTVLDGLKKTAEG